MLRIVSVKANKKSKYKRSCGIDVRFVSKRDKFWDRIFDGTRILSDREAVNLKMVLENLRKGE
jgi:hypothetical protein